MRHHHSHHFFLCQTSSFLDWFMSDSRMYPDFGQCPEDFIDLFWLNDATPIPSFCLRGEDLILFDWSVVLCALYKSSFFMRQWHSSKSNKKLNGCIALWWSTHSLYSAPACAPRHKDANVNLARKKKEKKRTRICGGYCNNKSPFSGSRSLSLSLFLSFE